MIINFTYEQILAMYPNVKTTFVPRSIKAEHIFGDCRYERYVERFWFYSEELKGWGYLPVGFICDMESVPAVQGSNDESGGIHDGVSRKDFLIYYKGNLKKISKIKGGKVYLEFQRYFDSFEKRIEIAGWFNKLWDKIKRKGKTAVVSYVPFVDYWRKHKMLATYEEITNRKEIG